MGDLESQEFKLPADLYIDCIEDTEVAIFRRDCFVESEPQVDVLKDETRLLSRRIGVLQKRVLMLMSSPAADRYSYFVEAYPELINRIPQHMIASYLGITPQALSTIRGRIART